MDLVCYLIINESLNMSPGKIPAQTAHGIQLMLCNHFQTPTETTTKWLLGDYKKVVLKADSKEWEKIKIEFPNAFVVKDLGYTEVPNGSETCICLFPMEKSQAPKIIKRLQTLK